MVREDLIEGAITFLQDPSVSSAPVEQRAAFLRSKNLTQEEIDASFARVGQAAPSTNFQSPPTQYQQPPPQYGNGYQPYTQGYHPYGQQPPPELPRRDWRDWFIAATVMGGVGYALYWTAKRYVYPLIAPPTPPQLQQDKASIDESFDKAFALLDQLATDTRELKESEEARKERLDSALAEVEGVIQRMKRANEDRETEAKRMAREINEIRDQIPRAIEKDKEMTESRIKELSTEMKSLKTLVANRMSTPAPPQRPTPSSGIYSPNGTVDTPIPQTASYGTHERSGVPTPVDTVMNGNSGMNGISLPDDESNPSGGRTLQAGTDRSGASSPYSRLLGGKAAIPSWQLAAKKNNPSSKPEEALNGSTTSQNVAMSGSVSEEVESAA